MRTIEHVLCPVDLSEVSRHAVEYAILLARWYHAKITALHVWNPIVIPATEFALAGPYVPPVLTEIDRNEIRDDVAACFSSAHTAPRVDVDVLVQPGQASRAILEAEKALPADLIVMGTHGAGGFEHLLLGSVTEKVLRRAVCPVMTVPPRSRSTAKLPFHRILCPIDFSDSSLAALDMAYSLAREGEAALTILHVFEWIDEPLPTRPIVTAEYRRGLERETKERLEGLVPPADGSRHTVVGTRMGHGKAYREIVSVATEESADLIVMGVHGRNALDVMLFGSTTNQVVRRATCPVLTLRS